MLLYYLADSNAKLDFLRILTGLSAISQYRYSGCYFQAVYNFLISLIDNLIFKSISVAFFPIKFKSSFLSTKGHHSLGFHSNYVCYFLSYLHYYRHINIFVVSIFVAFTKPNVKIFLLPHKKHSIKIPFNKLCQ